MYSIVQSGDYELEEARIETTRHVNLMERDGWECLGGVSITVLPPDDEWMKSRISVAQAMTKKEPQ